MEYLNFLDPEVLTC